MTTFLAQTEGFTPVIDVVVKDVGLIPAMVYGLVWRYCQMKDGVCYASLDRLANEAGVSRKTVERHIKALCEQGYLRDIDPDVRNKPHRYQDTGKVKIMGLVAARQTDEPLPFAETESLTSHEVGQTESSTKVGHRVAPVGHRVSPRSDLESHEDSTKDRSKDSIEDTESLTSTKSKKPSGLSDPGTKASIEYFKQFRRKKWYSFAQRDTFHEQEQKVGTDVMMEAVKWAAIKGITDVQSICTAAEKMGKRAGASRDSPEKRVVEFDDPVTGKRVVKEVSA